MFLTERLREGTAYARGKKRRFGRRASATKVASLVLSAASTVILGLQDLNAWADLALACVAVVTLLGAVEPFFDWRSRAVLMEEAQYRFHRLADDLAYLLATTPPEELTVERIDGLFARYQLVWDDLSRGWLDHRRETGTPGPPGTGPGA
ncbi:SLATT domain-containing protein [Streptomyces sp. NPDC097619]|uniref:SLATT domain-containing protein n=1 Tax=Streptomyces sp. NPDC097619 TaxID=3157228 RepID=UPI00332A0A3C